MTTKAGYACVLVCRSSSKTSALSVMLTLAADSHERGFAEAQVDPLLAPLLGTEAFHALLARFGLTARQ